MGTKERKEREREARRNDILEAAKTVFFEKGFHATTMDQIAEAAELSKGALYLYFPSKEELYVSILLEGLELLRQRFEEAVKGIKGWENKLRQIGLAYYNFYREHKNHFHILFFLQHSEISPNVSDALYQACFEKGMSCLIFLFQTIQEGIESGEIATQNATELSAILWGSLNGIILLCEEEEHKKFIPSPLDSLIQTSMNMMVNGLKKR